MFNLLKSISKKPPRALRPKGFYPLFDTLEETVSLDVKAFLKGFTTYYQDSNVSLNPEDFEKALSFLKAYRGSKATFNAYRRELERLFQWSLLIIGKSLKELKRDDIEDFIRFCGKPPKSWIGTKKAPRFIERDKERIPNPGWRPFVVTVTKSDHQKGIRPNTKDFEFSHTSVKELFAILSSFYNYLLQEDYVPMNPISLIRQKSKFIRKQQGSSKIRRLSELQWQYVIKTAQDMAEANPERYQRTLFIMSALYSMYLRISELAASKRWIPLMKHFHRDRDGNWWFTTVGKGNKERQIAVSDSMLEALKIWRTHLKLTPLPSPSDKSPLIPKTKGTGPITHTNYIRKIVQDCFDRATQALERENLREEAESLRDATVHWLRHTGISDDVKIRPREHVRDDAGHSSSAITDKYIDIELKKRHESAKNKLISE